MRPNWFIRLVMAAVCLTAFISGYRLLNRMAFVPDERTAEALDVLDDLNDWDGELLDIVECPDRHPKMVDDGKIGGWIEMHQEELAALGFTARWNRERKVFELQRLNSGSGRP